MEEKRRYLNIRSILLFIIGSVSCSNILSAFVVGSTPIMIANVLAIVLLIFCIMSSHGRFVRILHYLTKDLLYLGIFILLSIIQVLLFNPGNAYQWLVGTISLLLQFSIIMSIIESKQEINALYWGLFIGVIANFIISVYAMILYNSGVIFDLAKYFPAESGIGTMYLSNSFRARGLFKEQGHLMRFLAIIAIPLGQFVKEKNKILFVLYIVMTTFMMAFTGSSSVAYFLVGFFAYIMIINGKNATKIILAILAGMVIVFGFLFFGRNNPTISKLLAAFQDGFLSIFDVSGANLGRVKGMKFAIEIIKNYPIIGCGWNNFTKVFMDNGYYGVDYVMGSYSAALSLIAEIGLASFFYFYFLINKGLRMLKNRAKISNIGFGISLLIYFLLFCSTDYVIDAGSAVFIALVLIEYRDLRDKEVANMVKNQNVNTEVSVQ